MRTNSTDDEGKVRTRTSSKITNPYADQARSRITNGKVILPNCDQRSMWVRRFRDVNALLLADAAGADVVSEAEKALVRRAACLMVELERLEMLFALGDDDLTPREGEQRQGRIYRLDAYQRAANTLRRTLESLGLKRKQ